MARPGRSGGGNGGSPDRIEAASEGLVIAHLGQGYAVESAWGEIILCQSRRRLRDLAVGDRVLWEPADGGLGRVEDVLPRRSLLTRPGYAGRVRPVAANLDRVLVVVASQPEPDWLLVDQYLAACQHRDLAAGLLVNKIDLAADRNAIEAVFAEYRAIGYSCLGISARSGEGLAELASLLHERCSMLAGQSGVGKSSLTNALLPDRQLRTRELSEKAGLGRHTTTTATLYRLPGGGTLIDSPGVAVFGLAEMNPADLAAGYREFRPLLGDCRFADCRHRGDQGCAIRGAVEAGRISADRYRRFLKLLDKLPPDRPAAR